MRSEIIVKLLNVAIESSLDSNIQNLEGNSFSIKINGINEAITFTVVNSKFIVSDPDLADVTVSGSLSAFVSMLDNGNLIDNDDLHINGKLSIANRFQKLLNDFDFDWYLLLGKYLPESVAQKGATMISLGSDYIKDNKKIAKDKIFNLVEENNIFLSNKEYSTFKQHLSQVNSRIDNILQNIQDKINNKERKDY